MTFVVTSVHLDREQLSKQLHLGLVYVNFEVKAQHGH